MLAWRFREFGNIENFQLEEAPLPEPGPGEVLVRLEFAALNPADRLLIEGKYPGAGNLPLAVGRDGAGIIERTGSDGTFNTGDRVVILRSEIGITRQGTLAEYVAAPEAVVAPLPDGWTFEEGAAAPLVYLTAWKALVTQGRVRDGETVLVTGASGGVGIAAVHLAKALGARVVGLSRGEDKRAKLIREGADEALDSNDPALGGRLQDTGGVDLVVENLGGPFIQTGINVLNLNGRIMVIGLLAGRKPEVDLGPLLFKQVRIEGVHVGKFTPSESRAAWEEIVPTLDRAGSKPLIDAVYPMADVQDAFARLAGGHLGKVLVKVAP